MSQQGIGEGTRVSLPPLLRDGSTTVVLVAGVSGAGKSAAIDTFSDLGFFTIENLPVPLFQNFLQFLGQSSPPDGSLGASPSASLGQRVALALDIDSREKQAQLLSILQDFEPRPSSLQLVYLDCHSDVIIKRYGQTRRPHPGFNAEKDKTLEDTIQREKNRLFPVREVSNVVIDTSSLNIHALRQHIREFVDTLQNAPKRILRLNFVSFGFKHGVPLDCDLVVDVRFLPNPYFVDNLRDRTGFDEPVIDYVSRDPTLPEFITQYGHLLKFLLPKYAQSGKLYINVGVGCTGGRHRSVVVAESLKALLGQMLEADPHGHGYFLVSAKHRDIEKSQG